MALKSITSTATSGLRASATQAAVAADNIANVSTPGYTAKQVRQSTVRSGGSPLSGGTAVLAQIIGSQNRPDLATEFVRLSEAQITYKANAEVIRRASEISKQVINLKT